MALVKVWGRGGLLPAVSWSLVMLLVFSMGRVIFWDKGMASQQQQ